MPESVQPSEPSRVTVTAAPGEPLDYDGWPILENANEADLVLAFKAAGGFAMYGNFVRAVLAGIYAERANHVC